ncbi:XdhC family protein [Halalkalicoccus tibetensis]|uniref:XdhC family protein n=1 Tax=Halalkalicoccus tibetensis TaxID=175632 RepID=A0ABD5V712_9EURY
MHTAADSWSTTTPELFERIRHAVEDGRPLAVATVVDVEAAAYRRPGGRMLIEPDGTTYGGITAGCLEGPLREVAGDVLESGAATVVTYDLTEDDGWGLGIGCNGVIDVLVEPVDGSWRRAVDAYANREACSLVTAVESTDPSIPIGARTTVGSHGSGSDDQPVDDRASLPPSIVDGVAARGRACAATGDVDRIRVPTEAGEVVLVVDGIEPPHRLVVFGSQPDVRPVTQLAARVGLRVTVATARGARATDDAFPAAERVLSVHPSELADVGLDGRTSVVIMSHNFVDDGLALEAALGSETPYIGLMGPRKRFEELRAALEEDGVELSADDRERIATPVGLDLGGGEPMEIALSIVSEVVAVGNGRDGGRLVDGTGPVHERRSVSRE